MSIFSVTIFNQRIYTYKLQKALHYLQHSAPEKFEKLAENNLIDAFHRLIQISPAYHDLLCNSGINPKSVKNLRDFKEKVPVLNKDNFFKPNSMKELLGTNKDKVKLSMSSSGFSGTFAYGFVSQESVNKGKFGVDATLNYWFNTSQKKTFLINCAPMGVHVDTSLPLAETSVRSDMALALVKKLSKEYEQTIIAGDPNFLKKLVEEGCAEKIEWKKLNISLITAQDWLPESLRSYLAELIDLDPESEKDRGIFATMGMTELGLNVFHESRTMVKLRRTVLKKPELRARFPIGSMRACPNFFHYYPFRTYIESGEDNQRSELLFSVTDRESLLPLMRYSTGDTGYVIRYNDLSALLSPDYPELIPDLKLPVGLMCGRSKNLIQVENNEIYQEDIREGLFSDREVAANITGLIKVSSDNKKLLVKVQLKKEIKKDKNLEERVKMAIHTSLSNEVNVSLFPYFEFPEGTELSYERKLSAPISYKEM